MGNAIQYQANRRRQTAQDQTETRRRPATSQVDSYGKRVPGETGMVRKGMSEPHDWTSFDETFPKRTGSIAPAAVGASPAPTIQTGAVIGKEDAIPSANMKGRSSEMAGPSFPPQPSGRSGAAPEVRTPDAKWNATFHGGAAPASADRAPWSKGPMSTQAQGEVISTGRTAPNVRGERLINSPGSATNGAGGVVREVTPKDDQMQNFLGKGDPLLPKGAAGGMLVDKRYTGDGLPGVASVKYSNAPLAKSGRIFDGGKDVTSQYAFPEPRAGQMAKPSAPVGSPTASASTPVGKPGFGDLKTMDSAAPVVRASPVNQTGTADMKRNDYAQVGATATPGVPAATAPVDKAPWMSKPGHQIIGEAVKGWAENNRSEPGTPWMDKSGLKMAADAIAGPKKTSTADFRRQDNAAVASMAPPDIEPLKKARPLKPNGSQAQVAYSASAY